MIANPRSEDFLTHFDAANGAKDVMKSKIFAKLGKTHKVALFAGLSGLLCLIIWCVPSTAYVDNLDAFLIPNSSPPDIQPPNPVAPPGPPLAPPKNDAAAVAARKRPKMTPVLRFNVETLAASFERCLATPSLDLEAFLAGYRQLCLFMIQVVGKVAGVAVQDLEKHVHIIEKLQRDSNEHRDYDTIQGMVNFEYEENLSKKYPFRGALSCFWLNRATNFLVTFLQRLIGSSSSARVSTAAAAIFAYDATLAKHHSWFIQKTAHVGAYMLPSREAFIKELRVNGTLDVAEDLTRNGRRIYEITQKIYAEKNMLNLAP